MVLLGQLLGQVAVLRPAGDEVERGVVVEGAEELQDEGPGQLGRRQRLQRLLLAEHGLGLKSAEVGRGK